MAVSPAALAAAASAAAVADPGEPELERRLQLLGRHFRLQRLHGQGADLPGVMAYYRASRWGYRWVHSRAGAMHMALNPEGVFDPQGYQGQAQLIEGYLPLAASEVLELACGTGFNLGYLARRHPGHSWTGVDLLPGHLRRAGRHLPEQVQLQRADFHRLPQASASQDLVFAVEGLCHAHDVRRVLREVRRVLAPHGRLIVIDAWRRPGWSQASPIVQQAGRVMEAAMAVHAPLEADAWIGAAEQCGLQLQHQQDLTQQILPSLARLDRLSGRYLQHPLARSLGRLLPRRLRTNAAAGYLMLPLVQGGWYRYGLLVFRPEPQ